MRKTLLLMVVLLTFHYYGKAQSTCAQTLRLAQSVYDQGRLHELPNLLAGCLQSGFTDQEKVSAYKLLTLTYIYLEEPEKADRAMLSLLHADNEFKVNDAVDPAEFVALYNTFRTDPTFRIGVKAGAIVSQPNVVSSEYVNDGKSKYDYLFGFTGALSAEIPLTKKYKKFTLNPEASFQLKKFSSTNTGADTSLTTTATETQTLISVPVTLQYKFFQKGNRNAYVGAGFSADYLLNVNQSLLSNRGSENRPVEENSFVIKSQRNPFNANALVAAGFKTKISKGFLVAEIRFQWGLTPLLTKKDQYENQTITMDYKYVDAIFKLNTVSFTLGYLLNQYSPKKLTSR
jgi:hypothetical protein